MNELDVPIRRQRLGEHGLISFDVKPGLKYKWMLHESIEWFENAKRVQGPDWVWNDPEKNDIDYIFDSLGFRNTKEIEDISDGNWWLFEKGCPGVGPGIHQFDTADRVLEDITGIPCYNMSIYGDRPELKTNNLLELSKRWIKPPSKVFFHLTENPTGTIKLTDDNRLVNIDYAGWIIKKTPDFSFFKEFEESKVSEGHHRLYTQTIINICEALDLPLTWFYTGLPSDINMTNFFKDQDIIYDFCPVARCNMHGKDTFEERRDKVKETLYQPMLKFEPRVGTTTADVGRDLVHLSAAGHQATAEKVVEHFNLFDF